MTDLRVCYRLLQHSPAASFENHALGLAPCRLQDAEATHHMTHIDTLIDDYRLRRTYIPRQKLFFARQGSAVRQFVKPMVPLIRALANISAASCCVKFS